MCALLIIKPNLHKPNLHFPRKFIITKLRLLYALICCKYANTHILASVTYKQNVK